MAEQPLASPFTLQCASCGDVFTTRARPLPYTCAACLHRRSQREPKG